MRVGLEVSLDLGKIGEGSKAGVKGEMNPSPQRMSLLMTCLAYMVGSCPLHLEARGEEHQKGLKYLKWNPHKLPLGMPWGVLIPPHHCGRNRSRKKNNNREVQPQGMGPGLRAALILMHPHQHLKGKGQ